MPSFQPQTPTLNLDIGNNLNLNSSKEISTLTYNPIKALPRSVNNYLNPYWKLNPGEPTKSYQNKFEPQIYETTTPPDYSFNRYDKDDKWNEFNPNVTKYGMFNKPILSPLIIKRNFSNNGESYRSTNNLEEITFDSDLILDNAIITVTQKKNIIETKIIGKDGTIKEYIGMNDYEIEIKGVITGFNGQYPFKDVELLMNYVTTATTFDIECLYLNEVFKIYNFIINEYDISQEIGSISQQSYKIIASSDNISNENAITSPYFDNF